MKAVSELFDKTVKEHRIMKVQLDLGEGARVLALRLAELSEDSRKHSMTQEEVENAMRYLLCVRVDQIEGKPGNYDMVLYPEIVSDVVASVQNVSTDDGIMLRYANQLREEDRLKGSEDLHKLNRMCESMKLKLTTGFAKPAKVTSNVIGIEWVEEDQCHEASRIPTSDDYAMKFWVNYPRYEAWGELSYQLDEPGVVTQYIDALLYEARSAK